LGRKNKRKKTEYRTRLGFNPWKYITPAPESVRRYRNTSRTPQRGDIWFADLEPHAGTSVQGGCRPVLIVSNDVGNTYAETLNVLPMTRQLKKPNLPCHTELDPDAITDKHQMMDNSMILAEQITTISKDQLRNYVGRIEEKNLINSVDHAVSVQLGLVPISLHNEERSASL
jgi:mRNA interferase MazF